jgi:DNA modification methylase
LDYLTEECAKVGLKKGPQYEKFMGSTNKSQHHLSKSHFGLMQEEDYKKLQEYAKEKGVKAFKREYEDIKREYYARRSYFDNTHDNMNNVWHFARTGNEERELTGGHATPKPIALCSRAIKSSSREGEIVLDVFGGSGSTLIACEQLNRKAYLMELEPKWCDVIVKRWEEFTGKKAVKIN